MISGSATGAGGGEQDGKRLGDQGLCFGYGVLS